MPEIPPRTPKGKTAKFGDLKVRDRFWVGSVPYFKLTDTLAARVWGGGWKEMYPETKVVV